MAAAIDFKSFIVELPTTIFEGPYSPFGFNVIKSLMPGHVFLIFLLLARKKIC